MKNHTLPTRRTVLKAGLVPITAAVIPSCKALTKPKSSGETKVVFFGGDYIHNGVGQELFLRQTFSKTNWRLLFIQASHFLTPEVLGDTDLLMMAKMGTRDTIGFSPEGIVEHRPVPDIFLDPQTEEAIVENVVNRGMGFIAFHATVRNLHLRKLTAMLGAGPYRGSAVQTVRFHDFNPEHPITEGFQRFDLPEDENHAAVIIDDSVTLLFKSLWLYDQQINNAGWCVERGKGRVVALLAGHTNSAWAHPLYRQLHFRAAHWAMRQEIPRFEMGQV